MTSSLSSNGLPSAHGTGKGLASTPSVACTAACTSEGENANAVPAEAASLGTSPQPVGNLDTDQGSEAEGTNQADPLARLADAIASLTPGDRGRLAAMLAGHQGEAEAKIG